MNALVYAGCAEHANVSELKIVFGALSAHAFHFVYANHR